MQTERDFSRELTESLSGVFYVISTEGHFVRWNRNFEEITGKTAAETARASPLEFFVGDDRELIANRMPPYSEKGRPRQRRTSWFGTEAVALTCSPAAG